MIVSTAGFCEFYSCAGIPKEFVAFARGEFVVLLVVGNAIADWYRYVVSPPTPIQFR